jgi:Multiubiquitin
VTSSKTEHGHDKQFRINVNGVEKTVDHDVLTYDEVVRLFVAQPVDGTIYAVSFEHAKEPKEGELLAGQSVTIKQNTEFDVDDTGRS